MISHEQVARIRHLFHAEHWRVGTISYELGFHAEIASPVDVIVWIYGKQDDHGEVALRAGPFSFSNCDRWHKGSFESEKESPFLAAIDGRDFRWESPVSALRQRKSELDQTFADPISLRQ